MFLLGSNSYFDLQKEKQLNDEILNKKFNYFEVVFFSKNYPFGLSESDLITNSDLRIELHKPDQSQCIEVWQSLELPRFTEIERSYHGDLRILFNNDGNRYAFTKDGSIGMVNGKTVSFSKGTVLWFKQFVEQLGNLNRTNPPVK